MRRRIYRCLSGKIGIMTIVTRNLKIKHNHEIRRKFLQPTQSNCDALKLSKAAGIRRGWPVDCLTETVFSDCRVNFTVTGPSICAICAFRGYSGGWNFTQFSFCPWRKIVLARKSANSNGFTTPPCQNGHFDLNCVIGRIATSNLSQIPYSKCIFPAFASSERRREIRPTQDLE
jgi:hypothetical protein